MHIHILGICGTFMGGLALLARAAGHQVSGCDSAVYPPMSTQLIAHGIDLIEGFGAEQLALAPDVFVIGNVVSRGNPLLEAILNTRGAYTSGPQWLGEHLLSKTRVLAVAGTHGKTTTSAMLAWILESAGLNPGFLIGGIPLDFGVSARLASGSAPLFVIEADEYDTAFFDKRAKFLHYRPLIAILNNLEYDHADIFPDLAAIETQFHHLVRTVPQNGTVIINAHDVALQRVMKRGVWARVEQFGWKDTSASISNGTAGAADWQLDASDQVHYHGADQAKLLWSLTGRHNQLNGLAAVAAAAQIGVAPSTALTALQKFQGVKRRMEIRGVVNGITVYDDFAHHPTAISTTLEGLRRKIGVARLLAILEPRSNTMKLGTLRNQLADSLCSADLVYCYGETQGKNALGWDTRAALAPLGDKAACFDNLESLVKRLAYDAQPGDHLVIMSNGSFGGIHAQLIDALSHTGAKLVDKLEPT